VDPQLADGMNVFAVLFGVPVWGFAVLWIALAGALTVHTARAGAFRVDVVQPETTAAPFWCGGRPVRESGRGEFGGVVRRQPIHGVAAVVLLSLG